MADKVFKFLRDIQEEVGKETKKKVGKKLFVWTEHYNNWIDMIGPILKNITEKEAANSFVILRLLQLNNELFWLLTNTIYNAAYHQVIRELRFILESMMQAYYIDTEHSDSNIECKLEIIKEIEREAYGKRLIDRISLSNKDKIRDLYSQLSKYSHSSYTELEMSILRGKVDFLVTPSFDDELFSKCEILTHKVMDIVYLIVLNRFPQICEIIMKDKMLIKALEKFDSKITLNYLRSKRR